MKTIEENNKMIAEFLGYEEQTDPTERWFGSFRDNNGVLHKNTNTEPLLFHSSWDWLMPVVEKCLIGEAECEKPKLIQLIYDALTSTDISETYKACVQFIKWQTEQQAKHA